MKLGRAAALAIGGYLIGSISFSRAVAKIAEPGQELTDTKFELPGGEQLDYHAHDGFVQWVTAIEASTQAVKK